MEFVVCFILFLIFSEFVVPLIRDLVFLLAEFLELCLWTLFKYAAQGLAFALRALFRAVLWIVRALWAAFVWILRLCGRAMRLAVLFVFYLIVEWARGPQPQEDAAQASGAGHAQGEDDGAAMQAAAQQAYEQALRALGLRPGFTREALRQAYRAAIRAAHPDNPQGTGSNAAAQEVNRAYELILRAHGWAR